MAFVANGASEMVLQVAKMLAVLACLTSVSFGGEIWSPFGSFSIRRFDEQGNVLGDISTGNSRFPLIQTGNEVWTANVPTGTPLNTSDFHTDTIRRFDLAGNVLPSITYPFQFNNALVGVGNEVWATKPTGTGIVRFNSEGSFIGEYATTFTPGLWLTVVGDEVWNYEFASDFERFDKNGNYLGRYDAPLFSGIFDRLTSWVTRRGQKATVLTFPATSSARPSVTPTISS
jgi:hypothetical protein